MAGCLQAAWSLEGMRQASASADGMECQSLQGKTALSMPWVTVVALCVVLETQRRVSLQEGDGSRSAHGAEAQVR